MSTVAQTKDAAGTAYRRMAIALLALCGLLIAIYLSMYRLGMIGALVCGPTGPGCEIVQLSPWSSIAGVPVPCIGIVAYTIILVVALLGTSGRLAESRGVRNTLFGMGCCAFAFAAYNMSVEAFVIHAFCVWCATCAACAVGIFALSLPERPGRRGRPSMESAGGSALDGPPIPAAS